MVASVGYKGLCLTGDSHILGTAFHASYCVTYAAAHALYYYMHSTYNIEHTYHRNVPSVVDRGVKHECA